MTFWILVVGVPAALAAVVVGFVVNRYLGITTIILLIGAVALLGILAAPSHLERLVAADDRNQDSEGPPSVSCRGTKGRYSSVRLSDCHLEYLFWDKRVCVALLPNDELRYLDPSRCGIGD
jgi:hypothetical protein